MSGTPAAGTIKDPHESGLERVVIYGRSTMYRNWPNTSSGVAERFRRATQHTASEEEGGVRGALSTSVEQIRVFSAPTYPHVGALNSKDPIGQQHSQQSISRSRRSSRGAQLSPRPIARSFLYQPAESSLRRVLPPAAAMSLG